MREDQERCLAAGVDGYLPKPFSPDRLSSAIERFMLPVPGLDAESPLDMDTALQVVGGDRELLRQAVSLFLERDYPRYVRNMKDGVARQDAGVIRKAASGDVSAALEELETEVKRFAAYFALPVSAC